MAICVGQNGNVYVTGESYDASSNWDYATVKYDANGTQQWAVRNHTSDDHPRDIQTDLSGNVYVTGQSKTLRYSPTGTLLWSQVSNSARKLRVDANGNVFVAGYTDCLPAGTGSDIYVLKFSPGGTLQWTACYDGPGHSTDALADLEIGSDGNIYVTGRVTISGLNRDYVTLKYDQNGILVWDEYYGIRADNTDEMTVALELDQSSNVYVVGNSGFLKYSSDGTLLWAKQVDFAGRFVPGDLRLDALGILGMAGVYTHEATQNLLTAGFDLDGNVLWSQAYPTMGSQSVDLAADGHGNFFLLSQVYRDGTDDFVTIKYHPLSCEDGDSDGSCDDLDNCPALYNPWQFDDDGDGVGNECDNCPVLANSDQHDLNGNGVGDVCDSTCLDSDGDEYADPDLQLVGCSPDNCPALYNPDQVNCVNVGDPVLDGVIDVLDGVRAIDIAFRGGMPAVDSTCLAILVAGTDVNCDSLINIVDVVRVIDVAFRGTIDNLCKPCLCDCYPKSCPELSGMINLLPNNGSFERHCHGTLEGWQVLSYYYGSVEVVNDGAPSSGSWSVLLRGSWGGAGGMKATVNDPVAGGIYRLSVDFRPDSTSPYYAGYAAGYAQIVCGSHYGFMSIYSDSTWGRFELVDTLPIGIPDSLVINLYGDNSQFPTDGLFDRVVFEYLGQVGK